MSRGGGQRNYKRLSSRPIRERMWYRRMLAEVLQDIRDAAAAEGITIGEATEDRVAGVEEEGSGQAALAPSQAPRVGHGPSSSTDIEEHMPLD